MKHYRGIVATTTALLITFSINAQCVFMECPNDTTIQANANCEAVVNYKAPEGRDTCNPFLEYVFTTCNTSGKTGPNQTAVNNAYSATNLNGLVTSVAGIQQWVVPATGLYSISASGAQGGGLQGGLGAKMQGDFPLNAGDTLYILVGQQGSSFAGDVNVGGGGGTYVVKGMSNNILVIAGGGGGSRGSYSNIHGTSAPNGQDGMDAGGLEGPGGVGGNGGTGASCRGGGGAGWLTAGAIGLGGCGTVGTGQGGIPFTMGGEGGGITGTGAVGGFGGGGSSEGTNTAWTYAGGGGGYSGGGGASESGTVARAGGGGSLNNGTNKFDSTGINAGDGLVVVTLKGNVVTTTLESGMPGGSTFPMGVTTQSFKATDGTTTVTCSFNVTVIDTPQTVLQPFAKDTICLLDGVQNVPVGTPIGGTYSGTGISGFTFDPGMTGPGQFWIKYTDNIGCPQTDSVSIWVLSCDGVSEYGSQTELSISPNPGQGIFEINAGNLSGRAKLEVVNALGKIVHTREITTNRFKIDLTSEPNGVYLIRLKQGTHLSTGRLMKE